VYTFEVSQVKVFATDTAGDLLSYLRVLHPEAANEIRISKVGELTFTLAEGNFATRFLTHSDNIQIYCAVQTL
ncbi:hypothetical protein DP140_26770, partial [Salmonella enterica subsp. enterica serovar Weltevreden]